MLRSRPTLVLEKQESNISDLNHDDDDDDENGSDQGPHDATSTSRLSTTNNYNHRKRRQQQVGVIAMIACFTVIVAAVTKMHSQGSISNIVLQIVDSSSTTSSSSSMSLSSRKQASADMIALHEAKRKEINQKIQQRQQQQQPDEKKVISMSLEDDNRSNHNQNHQQQQQQTAAYIFDPNENDYDENDLSKLNIRSWGCNRNEAPFIFVHIGKAGGGSVRARMAASATDYNRDKWMNSLKDETYYYPIKELRNNNTTILHKGIFVNSKFNNFRPSYPPTNDNFTKAHMNRADTVWKTFEKTLPCAATTPLGQAIACPLVRLGPGVIDSCSGRRCDVVYTGHNLLGNELHWLPTEYLARWWYTTPWARNGDVANLWQERSRRWYRPHNHNNHNNYTDSITDSSTSSFCHYTDEDPMAFYKYHYHDCVVPREEPLDSIATEKFLKLQKEDENENESGAAAAKGEEGNNDGNDDSMVVVKDWSPLYASLPILRVTMMREPFSWLVSKFFWHRGMHGYLVGIDGKRKALRTCDNNGTNYPDIAEWVSSAVLKQINHLCGEDCLVRMNAGLMTLDEAEQQARHNLQHSFAVVGLLHETQTFYDMVTARAAYMDTTLNPAVEGARHSTSNFDEYKRCSETYQTQEFQSRLMDVCPELRALQRLYRVAVEVNRFQQEEMHTCGLLAPSSTSTSKEPVTTESVS